MKIEFSAHSHRPPIGGEVGRHLQDVRPLEEREQGVDVGVAPGEWVGHVAAILQLVRLGRKLDRVHRRLLHLHPGKALSASQDPSL